MMIELSDDLLKKAHLSEKDIKVNFAIFLFEKNFLTLEQASKLADLDQYEFQRQLGKLRIPTHYDLHDFKEDLQTIKKFA